MTLQNKTLHRYRQFYPRDTLREVSARTGIQITRVFRLFNGKTMKVGELEAFEKVISEKIAENPGCERLHSLFDEAMALLTNEELAKIAETFERKLIVKRYQRTYVRAVLQDVSIA